MVGTIVRIQCTIARPQRRVGRHRSHFAPAVHAKAIGLSRWGASPHRRRPVATHAPRPGSRRAHCALAGPACRRCACSWHMRAPLRALAARLLTCSRDYKNGQSLDAIGAAAVLLVPPAAPTARCRAGSCRQPRAANSLACACAWRRQPPRVLSAPACVHSRLLVCASCAPRSNNCGRRACSPHSLACTRTHPLVRRGTDRAALAVL